MTRSLWKEFRRASCMTATGSWWRSRSTCARGASFWECWRRRDCSRDASRNTRLLRRKGRDASRGSPRSLAAQRALARDDKKMRYLVRARVKPGREAELLEAIEQQRLGQGSVAEGEYLRNMQEARVGADETARWVEVCYCPTPLLEERPYWEQYFDLTRVQDAHDRRKCRDENGSEPWACGDCDCTARLEQKLKESGRSFLDSLRRDVACNVSLTNISNAAGKT